MMGIDMGFGVFGLVFMVLLWTGLIAGAVIIVRGLFPGANQSSPTRRSVESDAKQILDERYALGEVSRSEYEAIKQDLAV
jgi:uncharacterized membrane protein